MCLGMFPGEAGKGHNAHPNIDADMPKQLPAALADPIAAFGSSTVSGRLAFMMDVKDANGATVVMPVRLDAVIGSNKADIRLVAPACGKENNGIPDNGWFETQAKNLLCVNRKKKRAGSWPPGPIPFGTCPARFVKRIYSPKPILSKDVFSADIRPPTIPALPSRRWATSI